ncbi:hypothetical protein L602_000900000100 [Cupriavidus gilardii J11]|uniref:Uncharacterized protein n=1 Tax=Cupriavidus gilardii J11 TaxID=936133 RepID=A0A562B0R3_9BURK|nr:hypothetical protein L602_000900000100 [Cupriavidus gilardii J11]
MVVPLHHVQRIAGHVLARDIPGVAAAIAAAAQANALALSQRVEGQPDMLADDLAVGRLHRSRFGRQIAIEKIAEWTLADKADPGRILLLRVRQADLGGDLAHTGLRHFAQRKQRARQLRLVQPMQEVALVLGVIERLEQFEAAIAAAPHARIVAGGDALGTERHRVVQKRLELDLGIAQHVGVRRAAGRILAQEVGEYAVLVLGREIDRLHVDADQVGHRHHIEPVLARRAVLAVVVVFPVLHEQADDFVALLLQQPRGHRRIHAARHAHHDPFAAPDVGEDVATHDALPGRSTDGCVYTTSSAKRLPAR